ncbi:uncharacterized protein K452DRAFT_242777 [Aplosporella prunicola CBS 121167]|uniref:DUF6594 domain-containing protein n=1 Tax=Aplosporella prunicola CBS 121167 TaxID=1176127 RepID=A0A6A6BPZ8_9PEZI|nr:uncharacterized protein K452DRAFT_242777 [Aplosporella prunicola CBS 121167]KAF2146166.1 hypothetical protein K452DRAFT_242777 [Aplosporella prunicola CBS 121167]
MRIIPETSVFRRFGFLNQLNLLYLQADLVDIEDRLKRIQRIDDRKPGDESSYARDWLCLKEGDGRQLQLVREAQELLEKYTHRICITDLTIFHLDTALVQQSNILSMKPPGKYDLSYIQRLLASQDMGPWALDGPDSEVWGTIKNPNGYEPDIVTLLPRKEKDMFSKYVTTSGISKWFKWRLDRFRKPSPVHGLVIYEENTLLRLTYLVSTTLASLLPIASIVVLYFVHSMKVRLGIIAICNVLTILCLAFFTNARTTDIFAVAAAFSAVQVVFVQGGGDTTVS